MFHSNSGELRPPSPPPVDLELMDFDLDAYWSFDQSASFFPPSPAASFLFPAHNSPNCRIESADFSYDSKCTPQSASRKDLSDASSVLKERLTQALRYFKESTEQHVLVQVWVPVRTESGYVLTTSGQPFVLDPQSIRLLKYRTVSSTYLFSIDGDNDELLGLPRRVFLHRFPEWTPNVQYYSSKEYPRLFHALNYNVRGSLAVPIFESSQKSCIGVIELIMTSQKINYGPDVDKVCKALEAVNLKSSEALDRPAMQIYHEGRQAAFAEILEILTLVCETHKLPLAQTWIPCNHDTLPGGGGGQKISSSSSGSSTPGVCMATTDVAFYVVDGSVWGFRDACSEHHLLKGQGVAGKAFSSGKPQFSRDITQFYRSEYPLVHYARMFEMSGCLAICLQSYQTGADCYVLEFFLPRECREMSEQEKLLDCIVKQIKKCFWSLKVVGCKELQGIESFEIIENLANTDLDLRFSDVCNQESLHETTAEAKPCNFLCNSPEKEITAQGSAGQKLGVGNVSRKNCNSLASANKTQNHASVQGNKATTTEKRRGKPEKSISLDVLQNYFSGSLKDAAKSLGVCPTTMKRICRQHGISRWPSRKINKVNCSLSKLKRVIESVQWLDGPFRLTSLGSVSPLLGDVGSDVSPHFLGGLEQNLSCVGPSNMSEDTKENSQGHKSSEQNEHTHKISCHRESGCKQSQSQHSGGGKEPTVSLQSSSRGSQASGSPFENQASIPSLEEGLKENCRLETAFLLPAFPNLNIDQSTEDAVAAGTEEKFVLDLLHAGCETPQDPRNICKSIGEPSESGHMVPFSDPISEIPNQDALAVKVKASYKEHIIRFRLPCNARMHTLKEEISSRLKLEVGTVDIKYLDDDNEWVVLASHSDFEECLEISTQTGRNMVRISVGDVVSNLGSSCERSFDIGQPAASPPFQVI